jgi:hypothetical protein
VKPKIYASIGVKEYFLFDPYAEYLRPPLVGFRRRGDTFERMEANAGGQLVCEELGITLELDGSELVLRDAETGHVLLTSLEAAEAQREAAETRVSALEEELRRLRSKG